jgi:hypothetical protein
MQLLSGLLPEHEVVKPGTHKHYCDLDKGK